MGPRRGRRGYPRGSVRNASEFPCFNGAPPRTAGLLKCAGISTTTLLSFNGAPPRTAGLPSSPGDGDFSTCRFNGAPPRTAGLRLSRKQHLSGLLSFNGAPPRTAGLRANRQYLGTITVFQWGPAADGGVTRKPTGFPALWPYSFNGAPPRTAGLPFSISASWGADIAFQWGPAADGGVTLGTGLLQRRIRLFQWGPAADGGVTYDRRRVRLLGECVSMGPRRGRRGYSRVPSSHERRDHVSMGPRRGRRGYFSGR